MMVQIAPIDAAVYVLGWLRHFIPKLHYTKKMPHTAALSE